MDVDMDIERWQNYWLDRIRITIIIIIVFLAFIQTHTWEHRRIRGKRRRSI
jgi:hypothetical protein